MLVEPATLCLLRAAGSMSIFLELLQDKVGERESSFGEGLKRDCLVGRKMCSVAHYMYPLKPVLQNLIARFRKAVLLCLSS